jgi:hypothetical protein
MARKNGCYDREPLEGRSYPVQVGWSNGPLAPDGTYIRTAIYKDQPFVMKPECQFSQAPENLDDPTCKGCIRKWVKPDAIQPV